jgi:hypothetical protein
VLASRTAVNIKDCNRTMVNRGEIQATTAPHEATRPPRPTRSSSSATTSRAVSSSARRSAVTHLRYTYDITEQMQKTTVSQASNRSTATRQTHAAARSGSATMFTAVTSPTRNARATKVYDVVHVTPSPTKDALSYTYDITEQMQETTVSQVSNRSTATRGTHAAARSGSAKMFTAVTSPTRNARATKVYDVVHVTPSPTKDARGPIDNEQRATASPHFL